MQHQNMKEQNGTEWENTSLEMWGQNEKSQGPN